MQKKGFTLLELLAVMVVIVIIILIIVMVIFGFINSTRKSAFEASAAGLMMSAENECMKKKLTQEVAEVMYLFIDGVQSVEPIEESLLAFSGSNPRNGYILVDEICRVEFKISDGIWYAEKDKNNNIIIIEEYIDQNLEP